MDICRLLRDEIVHELLLRHCPIGNNVTDLRSTLRDALRREQEGTLSPSNYFQFHAEDELRISESKLEELRTAVLEFDISNRDNETQRIRSRLYHVQGRLHRLRTEDGHMNERRNELLRTSQEIVRDLDNAYFRMSTYANETERIISNPNVTTEQDITEQNYQLPVPNVQTTTILENTSPDPPVGQLIDHEVSANFQEHLMNSRRVSFGNRVQERVMEDFNLPRTSTMHTQPFMPYDYEPQNSSRHVFPETQRTYYSETLPTLTPIRAAYADSFRSFSKNYIPVSKWNLHYDGESSSLTSFLTRVEELRIARGFSKEQLFQAAVEIFTGDALHWYRAVRHDITTWDELVIKLRATFLPPDFEADLWEEIRHRTQHPSEKVAMYIAIMENLFNRLPQRPSEVTRLQTIKRNLQPYLITQLALHDCYTIEELTRVCRAIESAHLASKKYKLPPMNSHQLLEPDLGVRKNASRHHQVLPINEPSLIDFDDPPTTSQVSELGVRVPTSTQIAAFKCWNCKQTGHRANACTAVKTIYCYRCGRSNVTTPNCPQCSGNERRVQ